MVKSPDSVVPKLTSGRAREKGVSGKPAARLYVVRVFYAIFFGVAALGFTFQSAALDEVDFTLIGFCTLASLISFMLSIKPLHEG
ncbi:MAG: hypothetical protein JKY01_13720 [Pseudomonadales bacterium]|nr:hypothetical protein [Pseudomonadales bacterium]